MKRLAILMTVGVSALSGSAAWGQAADETEPRNTAVYGVVGFATPLGFAGLEAVRHFGPAFELAAGLGVGMSAALAHSGVPLQWAVMPRVRVGRRAAHVVTFGAGASGGNIGDIPLFCDEDCSTQQRASYPTHYWMWANVEVGGEHWFHNAFALRYFAGYARGWQVDQAGSTLGLPYFGVGLGRAF